MSELDRLRDPSGGLLVLSRKRGEILIFTKDKIPLGSIHIVEVDRGKVRLGIKFPKDIKIFRSELMGENE